MVTYFFSFLCNLVSFAVAGDYLWQADGKDLMASPPHLLIINNPSILFLKENC